MVEEGNNPATIFEQEYQDACKKLGGKPLSTLKFGTQRPPLPLKPNQVASSTTDSLKSAQNSIPQSRINSAGRRDVQSIPEDGVALPPPSLAGDGIPIIHINKNNTNIRKVVSDRREVAIQEFLKKGQMEFNSVANILHGLPWNLSMQPYASRYRFTPTMILENMETEEDEEILYRLEVRGWKIPNETIESLNTILPNLTNLSYISYHYIDSRFWNNALTDQQLQTIASFSFSGNLRSLSIDNNPGITETLWGLLCSADDLFLRSLTLRGNGITDVGAKAIASGLKTNRMLLSLNLFDNKIQKSGAEAIAESLKGNSSLQTLSLGKNNIGDEGILHLATSLANIPLSAEEVQHRKKQLLEVDRQKNDVEEDPSGKKKPGRRGVSSGGKTAPEKDDKKKPAASTTAAAAAASTKKKPEPQPARNARTPDDPKGKKGAPPKKGAPAPATGKGKNKKAEDTKEEVEEPTEVANTFEPMFELHNQWYILGNRTLNSLNVVANGITEIGLRHLLALISEQEISTDQAPEGALGLFRIVLAYNAITPDSPVLAQLNSMLALRNPFFEPVDENENSVLGDGDNGEFGEGDNEDGSPDEAN